MQIKKTIRISPKLRQRSDGGKDAILRFRVTCGGFTKELWVGVTIDADRWSQKTQKMTGSKPDSHGQEPDDVNAMLAEYEARFHKVFKKYELDEFKPTASRLGQDLQAVVEARKQGYRDKVAYPFGRVMDLFIEDNRAVWTRRTRMKYECLKKDVLGYNSRLTMDNFDEQTLRGIVSYFITSPLSLVRRKAETDTVSEGMKNSTINRKIKSLRCMMRWAKDKGYLLSDCHEHFRTGLEETNRSQYYLDLEELRQLENYEIPPKKKRLETVRDLFLFECYTGLRFSDIENLRRSDITSNGINITMIKTKTPISVPINTHARAIIDKYADREYEDGRAFPQMSNQKMNMSLKELGEMVGLDSPVHQIYLRGKKRHDLIVPKYKLLSTHFGRHTFVSISLANGVPETFLRQWTGHSSLEAMKPYVAIMNKEGREAMKVWDRI